MQHPALFRLNLDGRQPERRVGVVRVQHDPAFFDRNDVPRDTGRRSATRPISRLPSHVERRRNITGIGHADNRIRIRPAAALGDRYDAERGIMRGRCDRGHQESTANPPISIRCISRLTDTAYSMPVRLVMRRYASRTS